MTLKAGDDVWLGDEFAYVLHVSEPFKCGNILDLEGDPMYGREVTIFIEEDE